MGNESGTWIMYGVDRDDPYCIHTVDQLIELIEDIGFLPLFKNEIPGFSVEERTVGDDWWTEDPVIDPWEWREIITRSKKIAYGKFFNKKAGFISLKWLPYFVNYRRDGYDFDALWDDEKASMRQKKIMDLFETDEKLFSYEIKQKAGFGKGGEKNFEGTLTNLQMQMYLCPMDYQRRRTKNGKEYGWTVAVMTTPEQLWGRDLVTSAYKEDPNMSWGRIVAHMKERYPVASEKLVKRVLGRK